MAYAASVVPMAIVDGLAKTLMQATTELQVINLGQLLCCIERVLAANRHKRFTKHGYVML